ncbi:zf-DHHC-domain-containing protein [Nadsonia fulvescens var. elongata DSM 6958]|uniref:Palmitoyltransferase n=1 Tax=Nadsonia fulvescens var. elongata DSM 6958 TaxID=857566 RepID=A0A1E3PDY3_9ASCO|nr:zf-DHHC-domain-containing protein [Nadsonia fulvescens var. elongata DSM 6958]
MGSISRSLLYLCIHLSKLIPKFGVNALLLWSVYTHLSICLQIFLPQNTDSQLSLILCYMLALMGLFSYGLCVWSYVKVVLTGPGTTRKLKEEYWYLDHSLNHPLQRNNGGQPSINSYASSWDINADTAPGTSTPVYQFPFPIETYTAKDNGKLRYCSKCELPKPDRTHHCSSCHECVLKMDHHCPWFATCIGFHNHKFFVQFLTWVVIHCFWCFISSGICVWVWLGDINQGTKSPGFENDEYMSLNWIALLVVSFVFGIAVTIFDIFSIYMVIQNRTTLENMESIKYMTVVPSYQFRFMPSITSRTHGSIYDLGKLENVKQVMGYSWYEWVFPITNQCFKLQRNGAGARKTKIKFPSHVYFPARLSDFYQVNFPINKPRWIKILKDGMQEQQRLRQHAEHQNRMKEFRQKEIRHNMQIKADRTNYSQPGDWDKSDLEMDDF